MKKFLDNLYWLEQIQPSDCALVGNKAFDLSTAMQRGYPVQPGCVISAPVLWEFLHRLNTTEPLIADLPHSSLHLDVDNPRQLQQVAQRLCQEIITAPLPLECVESIVAATQPWEAAALIFRPSLVLGTAMPERMRGGGLLEAQICQCEPQAIALTLKRTWSQLFRAKSLLCWQRLGIEWQEINLAVLVQPLNPAIASGCLTCSVTQMTIQASYGLGMAIRRGEVLPDSYSIHPKTGAVRSRHLGNKSLMYGLANSTIYADLTPYPTSLFVQPPESCLQTYLLSEAQQQQYALKDNELQQLIQLAQKLWQEFSSAFTLKWVLSQSEHQIAPQLYMTQITTSSSSLLTPRPLIQGIAAAAGTVVATAYVISHDNDKSETLPPGVILVARAIAPDWLPLLQQVVGLVTEQGGLTSHGAILARELGIPAIVNAAQATALIQTGESVLVDGDRGVVTRVKSQESGHRGEQLFEQGIQRRNPKSQIPNPKSQINSHLTSQVPIATQLLVNLSQPTLIEQARNLPVDGVGLLRSELMVLNILAGQHPRQWLQQGRKTELIQLWQEQVSQFTRAFAPRPVFYRSLDWRSHEFSFFTTSETNPMLGQRGTFSYVQDPIIFDLELTALAAVQQSGYTNLHLLLPFVRTVEEFVFCRRRVEQASLTQVAEFQLWIMAEVPSILFLLPEYVKAGIQGISIGTNDLTQLLLGVDRDSYELAATFNERHPAVMQAIAQIIQMARQTNIPCSICGQAPVQYPEMIDALVRWGITSISVEPNAVELTYSAIARAEQRLLLESARQQLGQ